MVTAELAVAVPALVLVLTFGLAAISLGTDQVRCTDAARAAARQLARGDDRATVNAVAARHTPSSATITTDVSGGSISVKVSSPPPRVLAAIGVQQGCRARAAAIPEVAP